MTTAPSVGSARRRSRRGLIAITAGAVLFGVAGWQQAAQAAAPTTAADGTATGDATTDVQVSFGSPESVAVTTKSDSPASTVGPEGVTPAVVPSTNQPPEATTTAVAEVSVQPDSAAAESADTGAATDAGSAAANIPAEPSSDSPAATTTDTSADAVIEPSTDTVVAGEPLPLLGTGLTPGSTLRILLDGTTELAVVEVNAAGELRAEVLIPAATTEGEHVVSVLLAPDATDATAPSAPGLRSARSAVQVAAPAVASFPIQVSAVMAKIPPGGASSNTEGTSSSVNPGEVAVGSSLSFSVSGYPAGETMFVKIDDGAYKGSAIVSGGDIVATATVGSGGTASGSFPIPSDLALGSHTLRFLASQIVPGTGVLGFTHKSDAFVVIVAAGPAATSRSSTNLATTTSSSAAANNASSTAAAGASTTASSKTTTAAAGAGSGGSSASGSLADTGVEPSIGMAGGLGFMLAGAGMVVAARRNREDGAAGHA